MVCPHKCSKNSKFGPWGDIFELHEENSLWIIQNVVFWKSKNAESSGWGKGLGDRIYSLYKI